MQLPTLFLTSDIFGEIDVVDITSDGLYFRGLKGRLNFIMVVNLLGQFFADIFGRGLERGLRLISIIYNLWGPVS